MRKLQLRERRNQEERGRSASEVFSASPRMPEGVPEMLRQLGGREVDYQCFAEIDRRLFVPDEYQRYGLADVSIPIGFNQTTSRPSTCARILVASSLQAGERVLEIGCGSGYLLALFATQQQLLNRRERELFARRGRTSVVGIEKRAALASSARRALDQASLHHVWVRCADGLISLSEEGQFDIIVLSAAVHQIPETLLYRLTLGGRLIAPLVCSRNDPSRQQLTLVRRVSAVNGPRADFEYEDLGACEFVLLS